MTSEIKNKLLPLIPWLVLFLAAFLLYANTFDNAWTLDDFPVVVNNPDVKSVKSFFEDSYPGRPLREVTFLADHSFFGDKPGGYHFQNIFWHALNAFLIFCLVGQLGGNRMVAWISSLLFVSHPIFVEVVANISNRKDSLVLCFLLLSALVYLKARRAESFKKQGCLLLAGSFGLALLAKENALALPMFILAYEFIYDSNGPIFLKKRWWALVLLIIGSIVGFVWYVVLDGWQIHRALMVPVMAKMNMSLNPGDISSYFLVMLKSWSFMLGKFFFPVNLSPEYVFPAPVGFDLWCIVSVVAVLSLSAGIFFSRRESLPLFALLWLGVFWLPTSNVWPLSYFAADRYLYVPITGLILLLAFIVDRMYQKLGRSVIVATAAVIICCGYLTVLQNDVWQSRKDLWTHSVEVNPRSTVALNNLGTVYMEEGNDHKAIYYLSKAAMNFNDPIPYLSLAKIYEKMGNQQKAVYYYRQFLKFNDVRYMKELQDVKLHLRSTFGVY